MDSVFEKLNLNPDGELISDCSTRTLAFCLKMDSADGYRKLRQLQENIAVAVCSKKSDWNALYVAEAILLSRGWFKVIFPGKIQRKRLAELMARFPAKIFTSSYRHVSPIYKGKVWDTWDCSKGKVTSMLAPLENSSKILRKLKAEKINYVLE